MATDIVGSLFGVSPEMYQEERNRQGMSDAIAMARLDPMQYANAAIQAGAGRAAGGFAGLCGLGQEAEFSKLSAFSCLGFRVRSATRHKERRFGQ